MTAEWLRDLGAVSDDRILDRHHFDAATSAAKETVMEVTVNPNPPPDRPAYQTRVVNERDELAAKAAKLSAFLSADPANGGAERELLGQQWMAMEAYLDALNRRIELWSA